jgi:hypothetical protein
MSNWIYFDLPRSASLELNSAPPRSSTRDYLGKVASLVPGPVLGAYGAALGTLPLFSVSEQPIVGGSLFLFGALATVLYVNWQMDASLQRLRHQVVYVAAFIVWAYSLTGKTALPSLYHPGVAALLPILAGFFLSQVQLPKKPRTSARGKSSG